MKEFTWEAYDERRILICGSVNMCFMILGQFPGDYTETVYLCDENYAGMDYEEVLSQIEEKAVSQIEHSQLTPSIDSEEERLYLEEVRGYFEKLRRLKVKLLSGEEIGSFAGDYCILASRTLFNRYCKCLGYTSLEDFYSAVPILKTGYARMTYFGYLTTLYRRQKNGLYLGGVEINLTKRCTLRCRDCANLIQYYDCPERMDADVVVRSVKRLLAAVDGIAMFKLMGGEPLLEQEMMQKILSLPELSPGGKVLGIQIITNGTLLFNEDLLKLMRKNPLLGVLMSNYGSLSFKEQELKKQLSDFGVQYSEIAENDRWRNFGDPHKVYHDPEEASKLYNKCRSKENCCTVLDGRFYACPRAAHGDMLGFYPEPEGHVDLLGPEDELTLRAELKKFYYEYEATSVCMRCTNLTGDLIERAVQKTKKES